MAHLDIGSLIFDDLDQVKQFASRPRQERQEFFARYERSLDDTPRARPADADHQLFGLPQEAGEEEVRQRYRTLETRKKALIEELESVKLV